MEWRRKQGRSIVSIAIVVSSLVTSVAHAEPATKEVPVDLYGSDTMAGVIAHAVSAINASLDPDQISFTYRAVGSNYAQRQMEGGRNAAIAGEAFCGPSTQTNDGCQQVAPMSRPMSEEICGDDDNNGFDPEAVDAEGLAVCQDKIVMTVDNNDVCGGDLGSTWQAKLKLLYTGCISETGINCTAVARTTRCSRSQRAALIADWDQYLSGCSTGACPTGIRAAYRNDDASGTTDVFLEFLGLVAPLKYYPGRATYRPTFGACDSGAGSAPVENHPFCDGGHFEGFFGNPASGVPGAGDPIRVNCANEDDLCGRDGKVGIVRAIRSVPNDISNEQAFPPVQCTRGARAQIFIDSTSCAICPDGTTPVGGTCWFPYFNDAGVRNFNCMSDRTNSAFSSNCSSNSLSPNYCDGRAPNFWVISSDGVARFSAVAMPEVAQWRQNVANLNTGFAGGSGGPFSSFNCTERDATRNIGCIVGNTTCTTGVAGLPQALASENDPLNTTLRLDNKSGYSPSDTGYDTYPMSRRLWLNAIGGFENVSSQCATDLTNESSNYCLDQVELVNWFRNPTNAAGACIEGGAHPIYASGTTSPRVECVGAGAYTSCPTSSSTASLSSTNYTTNHACLAE